MCKIDHFVEADKMVKNGIVKEASWQANYYMGA